MAYGVSRKTRKKTARASQQPDIPQNSGIESSYVDSEHGKMVTWVNEADDATLYSRATAEKSRDYYDSKQWTDAERAKLNAQKQAATVINRIKPKIDALKGMEKTAKSTAKAYPRTPKHEKSSEAATEAIRFVLQDNQFDQVRSDAWDNFLVEGTCGAEVIVEPKDSDYRITINHLMWDRLIYDPHSRRKDFSDARFLGQVVWMDYDEAVAMYPEARDVLEVMQAGSNTYDDKPRWMDNSRRRVKIVELYYYRDNGDVWYCCFTRGGYVKKPKISPFVNEEGETEWPYEFQSAFVDREGGRYGAVLQLLDVQDEINKRRSKALHLMSVRQVRLERGAVEDVNKTRQELAKPDGVVETTPGMEFEVLKTGDMAAAQFNLLTEAKMEIDSVGANAAVQGKDKTVQSGVALQRRQQAGQTEVGPLFDGLRYWQHRIFRKVWNRIKQYWKAEKWVRVTDDIQNLRWVGLNAPITKGQQAIEQAQAAGAPPQIIAQLQAQIAADPTMQEVVDTQNDISELDVDIIIDEVPDVVTQQMEDFQVLGEMVKSGFPMPPVAVIEASPLSNKEKILKLMKEAQAQQVPEQVQEQMKKMQEELQALSQENQALKSDQQTEAAKLAAKSQQQQVDMQIKAQSQAAEIELERARVAAEIELKRLTAAADLEIQQQKMQMEYQHKQACMDMEQKHTERKMAFDENVRNREMDAKVAEKRASDPAFAESMDMPKTAELLGQVVEKLAGLGDALSQIAALQTKALQVGEASLAAFERGRTVSIDGIVRGADGMPVAANISTRMQ